MKFEHSGEGQDDYDLSDDVATMHWYFHMIVDLKVLHTVVFPLVPIVHFGWHVIRQAELTVS